MFMKDAGHMLKLNVAGRRRKSPPPPPPPLIRSHGRKLFMLDIATVNPLLSVLKVTTIRVQTVVGF